MASTRPTRKSRSANAAAEGSSGIELSDKSPSKGLAVPELLYANVSPHSVGGLSLFDYDGAIDADIVANFMSEDDLIRRTAQALQDAGFNVLQLTPYTINVAAPIATFERAFKTQVVAQELPALKSAGVKDTATFFTVADTDRFGLIHSQGTAFQHLIEGVAIETPRYYFATQPLSPLKAYWHLDVPSGVSLGCNADRAHRGNITGRGIKVAMVDSGHFKHPFFTSRGYRVRAVTLAPGASNASVDENGHGTAESANIFATAPDCDLLPVKMSFVNTLAAFNAAVALAPDVITCSWGSDIRNGPLSPADQALAAAITDAVGRGIVVVFAAGNGHWGFPGQHPDVISAGGVTRQADGTLRASNYASGFVSNIYAGRNAPDLCGLVGMLPKAAYVMLPLQPGCAIDSSAAGGTHPSGDETATNDGWAAISGTSAAAPQLAGVVALIKQACPRLTPAQVRDVLHRSAIDVTAGNCNPASGGAAAAAGPDVATGAGLVDAHAAVLLAKLRCLGLVRPAPVVSTAQQSSTEGVNFVDARASEVVLPIRPIIPPKIRPARTIPPRPTIYPRPPETHPAQTRSLGQDRAAEAAVTNLPHETPEPSRVAAAPDTSCSASLSVEDLSALEDLVIQRRLDPLD